MLERTMRGALQSICRRMPLYSGTGRIANSRPLAALAGDDLTEVRLSDGAKVIVDPRDMLGRTILYFGDQDRKISTVLRSLLRAGDTIVDVGANIGALSIMAARAVGPTGCVIAVEPQPDLTERIKASCSLNGLSNVIVHRVGLSDADGIADLSVPGSNSGYASLVMQYGEAENARAVPVTLRHAGDFLSETVGDRPLHLLKIDVEGHEAAVMRGARDWLRARPANFVLFEVNAGKPFWEREEVHILEQLGYSFHGIPHTIFRMRYVPLSRGAPVGDVRDVLAYRHGVAAPSL
jgi:FkbM family methyltransferase